MGYEDTAVVRVVRRRCSLLCSSRVVNGMVLPAFSAIDRRVIFGERGGRGGGVLEGARTSHCTTPSSNTPNINRFKRLLIVCIIVKRLA